MPQVSDVIQESLIYDKIKIKLASPSKIREWSRGEVQARTGSVIVVNIKRFVIKALSATGAVLKSPNPASAGSVWDISSWRRRYRISGISREYQAGWV